MQDLQKTQLIKYYDLQSNLPQLPGPRPSQWRGPALAHPPHKQIHVRAQFHGPMNLGNTKLMDRHSQDGPRLTRCEVKLGLLLGPISSIFAVAPGTSHLARCCLSFSFASMAPSLWKCSRAAFWCLTCVSSQLTSRSGNLPCAAGEGVLYVHRMGTAAMYTPVHTPHHQAKAQPMPNYAPLACASTSCSCS